MGCHARQSLDTAHLRLTRTACLLPRPLEPQQRRQGRHSGSYQILEEQGAGRYLSVPTAGLCYDTPSVEAMPFPIDIPDKTPRALS